MTPDTKPTMEEQLNADFDQWFEKLQALSNTKLVPEDWTERWFDYYTPEQALEAGPER